MEITTTYDRFLTKKESLKTELSQYSISGESDMIVYAIQSCIDDVFGEDYLSQLTEEEIFVFKAILKTIGVDNFATNCCEQSTPFSEELVRRKKDAYLKIGGIVCGLAFGAASSLIVTRATQTLHPIVAGLIIGTAAVIGDKTPRFISETINKHRRNHLDSKFNIDLCIQGIESLCQRIDDFMVVSREQLSHK